MATTTYNHVQIGVVDNNGNVNVLYPVNTAEDVSVDKSTNSSIPSSVSNVQDLVNNIGAMAFTTGDDLVYLGNSAEYSGEQVDTEINDATIGLASTWSSKKLNTHVERFIPTSNLVLSDVSALPITSTKFVVNGKDNSFAGLCPAPSCIWFVEYIPVVTSNTQVAGYPGVANTVSYAYQKWVGHAFGSKSEAPVIYERIYMDGSWGEFHTVVD